MAKLYFRYGAMNSGKSTALMQVAHNYEEQGMRVLILKPQVDSKGGDQLVSRLGVMRHADVVVPRDMDVFEVVRQSKQACEKPLSCVLCDESQFFTPEQAEQLFMVTVDLNVPVICYGLRTDFSLRGFPGSTRLLELAHTVEEMKTICTCGRKAICNTRMVNGEYVFEGAQVAIDQQNKVQYVSKCPQCYFAARRAFYAKHPRQE
jgi:thymidine kinase